MIQISRILCPLDFSECSRSAISHAVAIAEHYEATITFLHVRAVAAALAAVSAPRGVLPPLMGLTGNGDRDELLASLEDFVGRDTVKNIPVEFGLSDGHVAPEILASAQGIAADLIVLGTHGRFGLARVLLGSVAEEVLRKATCPVLTVPPRAPTTTSVAPVQFKHLVCAVDFSDCSMHALDFAVALAQEADANLTVIHVIELPPDAPRETHEPLFATPRSLREYVALAEADGRERLKKVIPESVHDYCTVDIESPTGTPHREILRVADERHADLVVIGIRGRSGLARVVFGSTAQHLVRAARCPVLTLRKG